MRTYLSDLRKMLSTHQAFASNNTNLDRIAQNFNAKIIWCPKYHCELNPIEGNLDIL